MLKQFLRRVNYRRCRENNKLISSFSGQGTIEYLVIIGVVIVLSLVVVGLVITQVDNSSNVSSVSSEVAFKVGVGGISLASSVVGVDGNGLLVIKNVNFENIVLSKVVVDGVDHNFYTQIVAGDEKSFKLQDVASCESGAKSKSYLVKVEYVSASGLTKIADFEKIRIDCAPVVIPASIVVEEVIIANVVPSIELNSPIDNNSTAETRVSFVFTPSDSDGTITSCSLNLTGSMDANSSFSIVQGEENTLEYTLSIGEYDWNITCMDDDGDTNTSETRVLTKKLIAGDNLVAHYLMNDNATNTTVVDTINSENAAMSVQNTTNRTTTGKINEALIFQTTEYAVTTGTSALTALTGTGDYSISFWAKRAVTYVHAEYFTIQGHAFNLSYYNKDLGKLIWYPNSGPNPALHQFTFTANTWFHFVYIKSGTTANIYVNGVVNQQQGTHPTDTQNASAIWFGGGGTNYANTRTIDDVRIYNRALSSNEILAIYNSGNGTEEE